MPYKDLQKRKEYLKQWRIKNRKRCRILGKKWIKNNPDKAKRIYKKQNDRHLAITRRILNETKLSMGGKCSRCGYDEHIEILEFHHKNPTEKDFLVARAIYHWRFNEKIKAEIKKCKLLCPNCHRILHVLNIN